MTYLAIELQTDLSTFSFKSNLVSFHFHRHFLAYLTSLKFRLFIHVLSKPIFFSNFRALRTSDLKAGKYKFKAVEVLHIRSCTVK